MFNLLYIGFWMLVLFELLGDSSWGYYGRNGELVYELYVLNGRKGLGIIYSLLVEFDVEGDRWEE